MIPIFREDYILAMQAFSGGNPIPVIRMFRRAAEISSSVPFELEFSDLTGWLREREAFSSPSEGKWRSDIVTQKNDNTLPAFC